ncbi:MULTISPECIES: GRP family sugar transporter [unclassified Schaalia]|uniref:GRP family sugar transporter n=1 Tax=unclassified Schaalia TaxID=2691889 RepID=UPI001E5E5DAD|nr:GRP family sugar transporter [Schaalia sp. lx-260]MCD4556837.1 GRP family sugar transporter [Schaalia sp. lx-100]
MLDILFALIPSVIFGSMSLLLMLFGGTDRQKITGLYTGGFLTAATVTPFLEVHWDVKTWVVSFISGALLGWGLYDQTVCLRVIGVSRTMPISTGLQLAFMSLGGVLLFGELQAPGALPVGILAIVLLIAGVWLTSLHEKTSAQSSPEQNIDWPRGIRLLTTSTIGLVAFLLLAQWFGIDGQSIMLPQSFGCLVTGYLLSSPMRERLHGRPRKNENSRWAPATFRQMLTGILWASAVLIQQISTARNGVAVGFTLSQLGVIISTLGGIVLLGEHRTRREAIWTGAGVILVVLGAVCAGLAQAMDT